MPRRNRYNDRRSTEAKGIDAWQPLVLVAEAGIPLAPKDIRTLHIREACFQIVGYFDAIAEGRTNPNDVVAMAQTLARYYDGYATLRHFGVEAHAQTNRPQADYEDITVLAEYLGGQWMNLVDQPPQPLMHIRRELEEMADMTELEQGERAGIIDPSLLSPRIQDWQVARMLSNCTDVWMAKDIGRPELPPIDFSQDQNNAV